MLKCDQESEITKGFFFLQWSCLRFRFFSPTFSWFLLASWKKSTAPWQKRDWTCFEKGARQSRLYTGEEEALETKKHVQWTHPLRPCYYCHPFFSKPWQTFIKLLIWFKKKIRVQMPCERCINSHSHSNGAKDRNLMASHIIVMSHMVNHITHIKTVKWLHLVISFI